MLVRDFMDKKATCINENATVRQAAELLTYSKASDLIVINDEGDFVGVLSEGDILRAMMPILDDLLTETGTLEGAAKLLIETSTYLAKLSIKKLIIRDPITLHMEDTLLKAVTIMLNKQIRRLPVVMYDKFVGSISRADVCWILALQHGQERLYEHGI